MILEMIYNVYDYQMKIFPWKVQNSFRVYFLEKLLSSSLCLSYIPFMFIQGFLSPRQNGFLFLIQTMWLLFITALAMAN